MSSKDTCDACRERKVKCNPVPVPGGSSATPRCQNCVRRGQRCTFEYTFKKPGRPRGQQRRVSGATPPVRHDAPDPPYNSARSQTSNAGAQETATKATDMPMELHEDGEANSRDSWGRFSDTIFGSARDAFTSPAALSFNFTVPADLDDKSEVGPSTSQSQIPLASPRAQFFPSDTSNAASSVPVSHRLPQLADFWQGGQFGVTPGLSPSIFGFDTSTAEFEQIESFVPWNTVCSFLALFTRHQHILVPIVHRPSFAQDLLQRRDTTDEPFRGLLLSIIAYTICQCPINSLLHIMPRHDLESLLQRCQKGSRAIQTHYQMKPSAITLASTILDTITSHATGRDRLRENLLADMRRITYSLGYHLAKPKGDLSALEVELSRRLFWEAYAVDRTAALNGNPIALPDFEGVPPLPLAVNDEDMTEDYVPSAPTHKTSYITGFVTVSRIFRILSQCLIRQRVMANTGEQISRSALLQWIDSAQAEVRDILANLPAALRPTADSVPGSSDGIQQANVLITALCVRLLLLDVKVAIAPGVEVANGRVVAEEAFQQLSRIPVECLASNGESMRGKVLRVILALINAAEDPQQLSGNLWDWWNIYSTVQFLQVIPDIPASAMPTRPSSPKR